MQAYHLWTCTTRRVSIFDHGVPNYSGIFACFLSVILVCFLVFTPGVQSVIGTSPPPFYVWFISAVVGATLLLFNETRKYFIRRWPATLIGRLLEW